jgi:hypothetical protein
MSPPTTETKTKVKTTDIDAALADLERQRAAIDPVSAEQAARATADAIATRASELDNKILVIKQSTLTINALNARIAADEKWREHLGTAREVLVTEMRALPNRIRDPQTLAVSNGLTRSLLSLDHGLVGGDRFWLTNSRLGQLLAERGYVAGPTIENQVVGECPWFGSLKEIDARQKQLRAERDECQHRLADALMTDEQRAARLAEVKAKNAAPQRKVRGDGSVYLRHSDGRIEEIEG